METRSKIEIGMKSGAMDRRRFVKIMAGTGMATFVGMGSARAFSSSAKGKIVVVGGGAAGISTAAKLLRWLENPDITIIDPSDLHYYQPGFTLIGGGVYGADDVYKKQADCIPDGAKWIKDSVVEIDPSKNKISTLKSGTVPYDFLVLAPGIQINWDGVEGISRETLGEGDAHCIYDHQGAVRTWQGMQKFAKNGGKGLFFDTYTKHKCGGAPKKICMLAEHLSRKLGTREKLDFNYCTASRELYDVPFFTKRLLEIYKERNIPVSTRTKLKGIDTSTKTAYFQTEVPSKTDPSKTEILEKKEGYDFIHFLPPMTAPDFVKKSGLSIETGKRAAEGWAAVDKHTLVHPKYSNIIVLGDASALPTSKTSAAVRKQYPIAARNLISIMEGKAPEEKYDGYAACPIVTDYGHVLMCEFDYAKEPEISFPLSLFDMSKESRIAWFLKVYALKPMYFYGMLNGLV